MTKPSAEALAPGSAPRLFRQVMISTTALVGVMSFAESAAAQCTAGAGNAFNIQSSCSSVTISDTVTPQLSNSSYDGVLVDANISGSITVTSSGIINTDTSGSQTRGIEIDSTNSGTNTVYGIQNAGTIHSWTGHAIEMQGTLNAISSTSTALLNSGLLSGGEVDSGAAFGDSSGVRVGSGVINGNVVNSGTMQGYSYGFYAVGSQVNGAITNSGTIAGLRSSGIGIYIDDSAISGAITNTGTISGTAAAIDVSAATAAVTINQNGGAIDGAINLSTHGDTVNITGGTISGTIVGQSSSGTVNFNTGSAFSMGAGFSGIAAANIQSGTVTLSGSNSATAATISSGATLALSGSGTITASSGVTDNGTFSISGASGSVSLVNLSGSGTVTLGANTLTLSSASGTFSGAIGGTGGLVLSGGSLSLSGSSGYTGATMIGTGTTLALSGSGSIAASSGIADSGVFSISGASGGVSIASLSGAGTVTLGARTLTLTNASGTFAGTIGGTGGVALSGGSLTLSASNTYTGATTIGAAATLTLSGGGALAASSGIADNGVFSIAAVTSAGSIKSLSGTGGVTLGSHTLTLTSASGTFSGVIAGTGALAVSGGTETLGGINTYTGVTETYVGATLALTGSGSVAASSAMLNYGTLDISATTAGASIATLSGTGAGAVILGSQTLTLTNAASTFYGAISGTGGLTISGGTETLSATNPYTGPTTIASGATLKLATGQVMSGLGGSGNGSIADSSGVADAGTLDISATAAGASITSLSGAGAVVLGSQTLTLTNAGDTFSGSISGTGGLAVTGGTESLTGTNSYSGGTTISGGTLAVASDAALGATTLASGSLVALSSLSTARPITLSGSNTISTGGASNSLTLSGVLSGSGGVTFAGGGTITLSGTNTYSGGTAIAGGAVLQISSDAALGASTGGLTLGDATTGGTLRALATLTSARPIVISAGGGTIDANGNIVTLTGQITQVGILQTISGSGGEVLFGGPTTVQDLTIAQGASNNSGTVNAAAGVVVASTATFTNTGTVNTSTLTVNGTASSTGAITASSSADIASGGVFSDNGTLTSGALTVGGKLRGTGIVNAPTTVTGTLAPGNSPGTLTFNAAVKLTASATTEIDIDGTGTGTGAGNYSRVIVSGAANGFTAAGTLEPLLRGITGSATNTYTPPVGTQFVVVSAAGGVSGTFASLTQPAGLLSGTRLDAIYGTDTVTLTITPTSFTSVATTGNEVAVATALDTARPAAGAAPTAAQTAVFTPIYKLAPAAVAPALDQLSATIYADGSMAARSAFYQIGGSVADQLATRRDGATGANTAPGPGGATIWTNALGQNSSVANGDRPGYHMSIDGAVAGIDLPVTLRGRPGMVGFAVGGASAETSTGGSTDDSSAVQFIAYGGMQFGRFFVDAQAAYLHADRDVRRNIGFAGLSAVGNGQANGGGAQIEGGIRLPFHGWTIEPALGLSGLGLSTGGISETGAGSFDEHIGGQTLDSLQSLLSARVERQFAITPTRSLRVTASLGWEHEFLDVAPKTSATFTSLGSSSFSVSPAPISRDAARIGFGIDAPVWRRLSVFASYAQLVGDRSASENFTAGLRMTW